MQRLDAPPSAAPVLPLILYQHGADGMAPTLAEARISAVQIAADRNGLWHPQENFDLHALFQLQKSPAV